MVWFLGPSCYLLPEPGGRPQGHRPWGSPETGAFVAATDQRDFARASGCPHVATADHSLVICTRFSTCGLQVGNEECPSHPCRLTLPSRETGGRGTVPSRWQPHPPPPLTRGPLAASASSSLKPPGKGVGRHTRSPWAAGGSISVGPSRQEQQMRPGPVQAAAPRPSESPQRGRRPPLPPVPPVPPRQEYSCSLDRRPQLGLHGYSSQGCSSVKLRTLVIHGKGPCAKALTRLSFHSLNQIC